MRGIDGTTGQQTGVFGAGRIPSHFSGIDKIVADGPQTRLNWQKTGVNGQAFSAQVQSFQALTPGRTFRRLAAQNSARTAMRTQNHTSHGAGRLKPDFWIQTK